MKAIRYSRYEGGLEELSPEEILSLLEDFLLDSGFSDPFQRYDPDPDRAPTLEDLYFAVREGRSAFAEGNRLGGPDATVRFERKRTAPSMNDVSGVTP